MRVLISGAGIAGPTLAWFLARTGARITVVEKTPKLLPHGQNVDIQGAAVTAIKKMGLLDELKKNNTREVGTQFIDDKGRAFAKMRVDQPLSPTAEFEILRGDLAAILYNASKDEPNVEYLFDTKVKQVVSNNEKNVKVELSNGQVNKYDLLVVADGQWSKLRKQNFPSESVRVVDKGMYCIYFTAPRIESDNNWWNVYLGLGSRNISTRPDPHDTTRAMLTFMPSNKVQKEAWQKASRGSREDQISLAKETFHDAGWQAQRFLDVIDQAPDLYFQAIQQIKMETWSNNRIVCLGDTAHAPTPLTGGGTTLAITGAYMLAGELSLLDKGQHPKTALEAYESKYKPHVDKIQQIPSFIPSVAHPGTAWKRWLLHTLLQTMTTIFSIPWVASRFQTRNEENDDGFPLPEYPIFSSLSEKKRLPVTPQCRGTLGRGNGVSC